MEFGPVLPIEDLCLSSAGAAKKIASPPTE